MINVSSGGMYSQQLDVDDLQSRHGTYRKNQVYARTKRAQVVLTHEWARRLAADGVVVQSMHPGWADTQGVRDSLPGFSRITRSIIRDAEQGADTIVWLAASPDALAPAGAFWHDRRPRPEHYLPTTKESAGDAARLWAAVEELAGR